MILNKIKRFYMGTAGTIFLMISIFLILFPIFPVRPLLKLVKICFFNTSEELYNWFVNHPVFSVILEKTGGLTKRQFIFRIILLFLIYFAIMFFSTSVVIRAISTACFVFSIIYYYYKTLK